MKKVSLEDLLTRKATNEELESLIEMAQYEIREWKSFIKLAKKRLS